MRRREEPFAYASTDSTGAGAVAAAALSLLLVMPAAAVVAAVAPPEMAAVTTAATVDLFSAISCAYANGLSAGSSRFKPWPWFSVLHGASLHGLKRTSRVSISFVYATPRKVAGHLSPKLLGSSLQMEIRAACESISFV